MICQEEDRNVNEETRLSVYVLNLWGGATALALSLFLLYGIIFYTTDRTPGRYGASPKDVPLLCFAFILVAGLILLWDAHRFRAVYRERMVNMGIAGEWLRMVKDLGIICVVPLGIRTLGFYSTFLSITLVLLLVSGVRRLWVLALSTGIVGLCIYFFLEVISRRTLPTGILF